MIAKSNLKCIYKSSDSADRWMDENEFNSNDIIRISQNSFSVCMIQLKNHTLSFLFIYLFFVFVKHES